MEQWAARWTPEDWNLRGGSEASEAWQCFSKLLPLGWPAVVASLSNKFMWAKMLLELFLKWELHQCFERGCGHQFNNSNGCILMGIHNLPVWVSFHLLGLATWWKGAFHWQGGGQDREFQCWFLVGPPPTPVFQMVVFLWGFTILLFGFPSVLYVYEFLS